MRILLLLAVMLFCGGSLYAGRNGTEELWKRYNAAKTETGQLIALNILFEHYNEQEAFNQADSVLEIAMEYVRQWREHKPMMLSYEHYFSVVNLPYSRNAESHAAEMMELAIECGEDLCLAKAYNANAGVNTDKDKQAEALEAAKAAYQHALQSGSDARLAITYQLMLADAYLRRYQTMEAFHNYIRAGLMADSLEDEDMQFASNGRLAEFYTELSDYESAIGYKQKQIELAKDSDQIMNLNIDLCYLYYNSGRNLRALTLTDGVVAYAVRKGNTSMKENAFQMYRGCLINSGNFIGLYRLYHDKYPKDYGTLAKRDTTLYYRVSAFIKEVEGKEDSAQWYYDHAASRLQSEEEGATLLANFYRRYGQFLLRTNDTNKAVGVLREAYGHALQANNQPYLVSLSGLLDTAEASLGHMDEAYKYRGLHMYYTSLLASSMNRDDVIKKEIAAERKREQLHEEREERRRQHLHALEYTGIAIGIPTAFILLALIASFEVPRILIKAIGFFSVIFLFEFILLLLENWIGHITHHDPLGIMACKIVIAAVLLPLHHLCEEKVVHYFSTHKLLLNTRLSFRRFVQRVLIHLRGTKKHVVVVKVEEEVPEVPAVKGVPEVQKN